ncbi:hypothetical protein DFH08DRAFT_944804 [Mycena albidolilacea]|uniref:Uncharacterized protein n=1 Tax=Mycena albidolilacea TaxID=1033008 RepID=A0AAD6Z3Z5_9AGAR|nr:hypothetical protein DFH08DRAFT_944804 [Mycena albidolilacea]
MTPDHPLNDRDLQNFLKAARCLQRVCQLWATLAQELLYDNIWVNDSVTRWVLLFSVFGQPIEHRKPARVPEVRALLRLPSKPYLAASVKHLTLSSSPSIGSAFSTAVLSEPGPTFPSLSRLQSLVLLLFRPSCARVLLHDADLARLTHLTIVPGHLEWEGFPVLPALRTLTLFDDRTRTLVPFPAILTCCPALEELRYSCHISATAPTEEQTAGALGCVRIYLGLWLLQPVRAHAKILLGAAFSILERVNVVLDGPGWAGALELDEWAQLRVRGCAVEEGYDTPSGDY